VRLRLMHIDFFHNSQFKLSHGLSQLAAKPSRCAALVSESDFVGNQAVQVRVPSDLVSSRLDGEDGRPP
jgi:hypothetical protein